MTVAAFFRDARVSNSISHATPSRAESLVRNFMANYALTECNGAQLLALADLALRSRQYDTARQVLTQAVGSANNRHMAFYKLGRVEVAVENYSDAARHFLAGAELEPSFPQNWIGAAHSLHAMGEIARAAELAERFADFGVRPQAKADLAVIGPLADHLFETDQRRRSLKLYRLLTEFGKPTARDAVRLAESLIAGHQFREALAHLVELEQSGPLEPWGKRAMATCLSHCGEHARAAAVAEEAVLDQPKNQGFINAYVDVLARGRDAARIGDALERHAAILLPQFRLELRTRLFLLADDIVSAAAALDASAIPPLGRLLYLSLETGYAALHAGLTGQARILADRLAHTAPDNVAVKMLGVDAMFRDQQWEQAAEYLDNMPEETADHTQVLLKRFELACFLGRFGEAAPIWDRIELLGEPPRHFMPSRFRFLAEQKRWNEVVDTAVLWIDASFSYNQVGYVLFRAASHTGRQADLISAIEAIQRWEAHASLFRLRCALALSQTPRLDTLERILHDPGLPDNAVLFGHAESRHRIMARAARPACARRALFLCTNGKYLCATVVALHSASRGIDKANVDIFIVVDDDIAGAATRFVRNYNEAGFNVTIVPASQVVDAAEKLHASYGLFTSGHALASAAYFRIYFAQHLARCGTYERAIYMDGDILLRRPLNALFELSLNGSPMAARQETMRPEVRRAIELHQLEDGFYFNSGVLLFDLKNPELPACLGRAVAAIGDDSVTLLYHDQCALNLGFRSQCADLSMDWNFPIGEATALADIPPDAAMLHFLDRPKPWSPAYGGECAALWFAAWEEVASFIGDQAALDLLALCGE